jgi:nucleotide-binding universal stress UspA family protein
VREAAAQKLERILERMKAEGIECALHLCPGHPVGAILDTAEEVDADLIVMGTRGLSGLKHVLLGSVAERTIRTAPCPVLTVR